ncbi:hypothetical protein Tco_1207067 [Tanacetum coccineum]
MSAYGFLLPCSNTIIIAGDDEHVVQNGLVDKVSVSNTSEELLDHDEYNHESLMSIARFIGWYEILPPIIGKMRRKRCVRIAKVNTKGKHI